MVRGTQERDLKPCEKAVSLLPTQLLSSRPNGCPSEAEPVCSLVKRPDDALEPFDSFLSHLSHRALIVVCISVCVVVCKTVAGLPWMTRPQLNYFLSCASHAISVSYINLAGMLQIMYAVRHSISVLTGGEPRRSLSLYLDGVREPICTLVVDPLALPFFTGLRCE